MTNISIFCIRSNLSKNIILSSKIIFTQKEGKIVFAYNSLRASTFGRRDALVFRKHSNGLIAFILFTRHTSSSQVSSVGLPSTGCGAKFKPITTIQSSPCTRRSRSSRAGASSDDDAKMHKRHSIVDSPHWPDVFECEYRHRRNKRCGVASSPPAWNCINAVIARAARQPLSESEKGAVDACGGATVAAAYWFGGSFAAAGVINYGSARAATFRGAGQRTRNTQLLCFLWFAPRPLHSRLAGWMPHSLLRRLCSKKVTGFICWAPLHTLGDIR